MSSKTIKIAHTPDKKIIHVITHIFAKIIPHTFVIN